MFDYHRTRKAIALGTIDFRFVQCNFNWADIVTQALPQKTPLINKANIHKVEEQQRPKKLKKIACKAL